MNVFKPGDRVRVSYDATVIEDRRGGDWVSIQLDGGLGQRAADRRTLNHLSASQVRRERREEAEACVLSALRDFELAQERLSAVLAESAQ